MILAKITGFWLVAVVAGVTWGAVASSTSAIAHEPESGVPCGQPVALKAGNSDDRPGANYVLASFGHDPADEEIQGHYLESCVYRTTITYTVRERCVYRRVLWFRSRGSCTVIEERIRIVTTREQCRSIYHPEQTRAYLAAPLLNENRQVAIFTPRADFGREVAGSSTPPQSAIPPQT